jgi:hypothetical protein
MIYSVLLLVVLVYWVLAIVGIFDFNDHGPELDPGHDLEVGNQDGLHVDTELSHKPDDVSELASFLMAMGLDGVPFSIVVSFLVLIPWVLVCLSAQWLIPLVPTDPLRLLAGLLAILAAQTIAIPITARLIRPLRGLFVRHTALRNRALVGHRCKVLTLSVDEKFGRAEAAVGNSSYNLSVRASSPNILTRGSETLIIDYDEATGSYLVAATALNVQPPL